MLPVPNMELNWALLGSTGLCWDQLGSAGISWAAEQLLGEEMPLVLLSIPPGARLACTLLQCQPGHKLSGRVGMEHPWI